MSTPYLSIVIPVFNEKDSLPLLLAQVIDVMRELGHSYELIVINDGSTDNSLEIALEYAGKCEHIRVIDFRRNYGQTAAIMAGIDHSIGEILISIDADLQNDPRDIAALLAKLDEGYDLVSGWRSERQDAAFRRNFMSNVANWIISRISGVHLHDYGCTLKAYRRELIRDIKLYGEMHRFIPIYASWMGARITEIKVRHHARKHGTSNYGMERVAKVALDMLVVKFLDRHFAKPIYVFGGFGFLSFFLAFISGGYMLYLKLQGYSMILTPLPVVTVFLLLVGVVSILMGLLAEMLVRTYFESQGRASYNVRSLTNFDRSP